jgi:ribonuclease HI
MAKQKYYAVVVGRKPGLYDEWFGADGAEAQVKGLASAVYKSFQSRGEAEAWYREKAGHAPTNIAISRADEPGTDYFQLHHQALAAGKVVLYTDGGCLVNPGAGGYGVVMLHNDRRKELSSGYARTTNNRMELMACIAGLEALKQPSAAVLFSDSSYVVNGIEKGWAQRWRANGWRRSETGQSQPVKNADLWGRLLDLCDQHTVQFVLVKGHAGAAENERCHQLASAAMQRATLPPDPGFDSAEK